MSNPHNSADFHQDELQFDEAEFTEPAHAVTACTACQTPIADLYYEAGGKIVCDPCRHQIEAMFHGGSRLGRAFKALIMGTIAAAACAILHDSISKVTGGRYRFLLVICSGLIIGAAVKTGSKKRGGRFYQLMALFLTYSALVAMLVPGVIEAFQEKERKDQARIQEMLRKARVEAKAELKKNSDKPEVVAPKSKDDSKVTEKVDEAKAKPDPKTPAPKALAAGGSKDGKTTDQATKPAATKEVPDPAVQAENVDPDGDDDEEDPDIVDVNLNAGMNPAIAFLAIVAMVLVAYSFPILNAFHAPILGAVYAFALWEAWKLNRKVQLVINGPFHLAADRSLDLATEDFDDEQ